KRRGDGEGAWGSPLAHPLPGSSQGHARVWGLTTPVCRLQWSSPSLPAPPPAAEARKRSVPVLESGNFDGNFESLDLAEFAKKQPWWRKLFGQESGPSAEKYSVATQLFIGGVTGWCTGFIFQKVGKLAATAVGGGFFLLQLANHTGYIKVDWQRVEKDMKKAKEQLKIRKSNQMPTEVRSKAEEVVSFVKKNVLVTGGFFGGFLLGMAS
uniref:FUN14 domain-containing protein 2 n=1 Tax=Macaca mulatta TaxID=9544 RepID=F6QMB1_MACMU